MNIHIKKILFFITTVVLLLSCFFINKKINNSAEVYKHENRMKPIASSSKEHGKHKVVESRNLSSKSFIERIRDALSSSKDEADVEHKVFEIYPRDLLDQATFVPVKVGTFQMGSPVSESQRELDEGQHLVTLTKDFEIGITEVTQLQWVRIMNSNPSQFQKKKHCPDSYMEIEKISLCSDFPVEQVSWNDVQLYLKEYNNRANDNYVYRLPTEAEWEFIARAGTSTTYSFGDNTSELVNYAWFYGNSGWQARAVATRLPNPLHLYDVHGNVWEFVEDWYGDYSTGPVTDPISIKDELIPLRVVRGGGWRNFDNNLRSADRSFSDPVKTWDVVGFRLVRRPK